MEKVSSSHALDRYGLHQEAKVRRGSKHLVSSLSDRVRT